MCHNEVRAPQWRSRVLQDPAFCLNPCEFWVRGRRREPFQNIAWASLLQTACHLHDPCRWIVGRDRGSQQAFCTWSQVTAGENQMKTICLCRGQEKRSHQSKLKEGFCFFCPCKRVQIHYMPWHAFYAAQVDGHTQALTTQGPGAAGRWLELPTSKQPRPQCVATVTHPISSGDTAKPAAGQCETCRSVRDRVRGWQAGQRAQWGNWGLRGKWCPGKDF